MHNEAFSIVQAARGFLSGKGQIELEKAFASSRRAYPRLVHIASQIVAGGVLVELSTVAASCWSCAAGHRGAPVARAKL